MADLRDSIRLTTEVDLEALSNAIKEYKTLGITVSGVATASRLVTEQLKKDALEKANAAKQAILSNQLEIAELNKKSATIKSVSNELIAEEKVNQSVTASSISNSKLLRSNIELELLQRRNLIAELRSEGQVSVQISQTSIAASNAKKAALNAEIAAGKVLITDERVLQELERTSTAQINTQTAAIRQQTAANQQSASATRVNITETQAQREATRLSTEQQRLYNAQLRNKALESANAEKASRNLGESLNVLTGLRSQMIGLFGIMSIGSFAKDMIDAQSTVQAFGLSMKNLLGNAYGEKLLNDLKVFTVNTPLDFQQVIKSTNQLVGSFKAAGASSKEIGTEVPKILESIGNSAASLGGDDRMGRLIYAFSQVQATGRLMGTEVRQITETGFPMLAVLTQSLNERFPKLALSVSDVQKRISDGAVSFDDFRIAMLSAGQAGGVFAGGMEARMATVAGSLDKLKESTFFALANIGNQFNDLAKRAIDFGSNIVQALFGTDSAAKRSVEVIKTLISTWAAYTVTTRLASAQLAASTIIEKAALILRGELVLANLTLAGSTNTFSAAQLKAAFAARTFNAAIAANPLGLFVVAIGAVVAAYEIYNGSVKEAQEKQRKLFDDIGTAIAPIKAQKEEFNNLAKAVLSTSLSASEQERTLQRLKLQYPLLLKGVTDLSTAEDILNKNKIKTNSTLDFRNEKLNTLKAKYPEQLKGIDTLAEAEIKLASVVRITNRDFAILTATMENNVRMQAQLDGATDNFKKKLEAEREIARIKAGGAVGVSNIFKTEDQIIASEQAKIVAYDKTAKAFAKAAEVIRAENARLAEEITFKEKEKNNILNNLGKEGKEKALKYQSETIMQSKIMDEIAFRRELESTRDSEIAIRTMEKLYADLRLKDAIGSQKQKQDEQTKLDNDFANDIANLKRKWNAKEKADVIKDEKEKNKEIEKEAAENAKNLWDVIWKRIEDERKAKEDLIEDLAKLDEKAANEQFKLNEDTFKLQEKLRILEKISIAKNSKEIIEIENQEKEKILLERKDRYNKEILIIDAKLKKLKDDGKVETIEYKELQIEKLKLEQDFTNAAIDLAQFVTEKKKDEIEKQMQDYADAMKFIEQSSDAFFGAVNNWIDKALSETTDLVTKAQLENQRAGIAIAKQGISAISSFASGDFVGGFFKTIGTLYNVLNITNDNAARLAKANLEKATELLKNYLSVVEKDVDALMSKFDTIKEVYGNIQTMNGGFIEDLTFNILLEDSLDLLRIFKDIQFAVDDIVETSGVGIGDLIQGEIARGQEIQKNYDSAVEKENDLFEKRKDSIEQTYEDSLENINNLYEEEVAFIDKKYQYESLRANQQYNTETLAITAAGTAQLEALITNETVLSEVRAEFAAKRLQIEEAFPLASKKITSDMSQAEVDAINASIEARDEAFAQLQERYNAELVTIAEAEGQKRKEYTATEKIQNGIRERLELAAIAFEAAEIERERLKGLAIEEQEFIRKKKSDEADATREAAKLVAKANNDAALIALEKKKNEDIAESFTILTQLLVNQSQQIAYALANSAAVGTEAYKELQNQLEVVNRLLDQIRNGNTNTPFIIPTNIPFDFPIRIGGFEKGTDNTSVSLSGATVDNRGGKLAVLHPDEAVFSKADMTQMTRFLGKRPTRDEVIDRFKMGTKLIDSNSFIQKISPYVINKSENNNNTDVRDLTKKIERLTKEVVKRQQPMVTVDKNGIRTFVTNINSQIEIKNQKFSS